MKELYIYIYIYIYNIYIYKYILEGQWGGDNPLLFIQFSIYNFG